MRFIRCLRRELYLPVDSSISLTRAKISPHKMSRESSVYFSDPDSSKIFNINSLCPSLACPAARRSISKLDRMALLLTDALWSAWIKMKLHFPSSRSSQNPFPLWYLVMVSSWRLIGMGIFQLLVPPPRRDWNSHPLFDRIAPAWSLVRESPRVNQTACQRLLTGQ